MPSLLLLVVVACLVIGSPSFLHLAAAAECFADRAELKTAVDQYVSQNCANNSNCNVGQIYGWPMNSWCVGSVTNMYQLFLGMDTFNEDISAWDVSNVVNMMSMFRFASSFNGDLSSWITSSLQGMNSMFDGATAFESDLSGKYKSYSIHISMFQTFTNTANLPPQHTNCKQQNLKFTYR